MSSSPRPRCDADLTLRSDSGWISVKSFRFEADVPPDTLSVLTSVMEHYEYNDLYIGVGLNREGQLHGPYFLDQIGRDAYDEVSPDDAIAHIEAWEYPSAWPDAFATEMYRAFVSEAIRRAAPVLRLRDLPASAQHPAGWVLDEFREVVCVEPGRRRVHVIVAGSD